MKSIYIFSVAVALAGHAVADAVDTNAAENATGAAETTRQPESYTPSKNLELTDSEVWNNGVDLYRAGDFTNALATLKPLMLSRTHGARASELVSAIAYERKDLEEAAAAAQAALRAAPDDARLNRNYTRATDGLPELREARHVEEVLKRFGQQPPDGILGAALRDAQALMAAQKGVLTNEAHLAIAASEALAARAENLVDAWIPVKEFVMQTVTNEQDAATIVGRIEAAREASRAAAEELADLNPDAETSLAKSETFLHDFWLRAVLPPAAIDADIIAQTNSFEDLEAFNGRDWQREALALTAAFREKFPAWAKAYEQQAQADTNKPPFTKEAQDKINALSAEVEKKQLEMVKNALPPEQLRLVAMLEEIRDLLPKDPNGGQGGQQQQQNNDQNKDDNKNKDDQQNQNQQQQQDQQKEQQKDQPKPEENKDEKKKEEPKNDQEVEALLQKAQDRSDEHEDKKRALMKNAPISPNERDW